MAWSFATLPYPKREMMEAISKSSIVNISEFDCQSIGNTAFAYASLRMLNRPLMHALSSEAIRKIHEVEPQCLAVLTELALPDIEPLEAKLEAVADYFVQELPPTVEDWHRVGYPQSLRDLAADHLGAIASKRIFAQMDILEPGTDFLTRAGALFPYSERGGEDVARSRDATVCARPTCRRVYAYCEWELSSPDVHGGPLRGHVLRENGYVGYRTWQKGWLRPCQLPNNPHIDHTYCAEFQILSEICDKVSQAGMAEDYAEMRSISGGVRLLVSTTPCLSCVCAFHQFRLIFPDVRVEFGQLRPWEVKGSYGGAPKEQVAAELTAAKAQSLGANAR